MSSDFEKWTYYQEAVLCNQYAATFAKNTRKKRRHKNRIKFKTNRRRLTRRKFCLSADLLKNRSLKLRIVKSTKVDCICNVCNIQFTKVPEEHVRIHINGAKHKKKLATKLEITHTSKTEPESLTINTDIELLSQQLSPKSVLTKESDDSIRNIVGINVSENPNTIQITKSSNIDNEYNQVLLYGISLGTHSHHWVPGFGSDLSHIQRPKIMFNKHQRCMDIYLNSTDNDYVPVTIHSNNIANLIIPSNPSYFSCTGTGQCINVLFLVLKAPLKAYGWLDKHFCPKNTQYDAKSAAQSFVTMYIDSYSLEQLSNSVLMRSPFGLLDKCVFNLSNDDKYQMLSFTSIPSFISEQWKKINALMIDKHDNDINDYNNMDVNVDSIRKNNKLEFNWNNRPNNNNKKKQTAKEVNTMIKFIE
eukprot:484310_1